MGFVDPFHNKYQTGGLQHLLAKQVREEVGKDRFDSFFKFAVVRNPFDRLVSQFAYMKSRPDLRSFINLPENSSFSEYLRLIRCKRHVQWEPQCSFLYDDRDVLLMDRIVRFESLDRDLQQVFARLGVTLSDLPHHLATERGPYRAYYSDSDRVTVESMYGDDLVRLGYAF